LGEVAVPAGHKVILKVDKNISLIVSDPKGIFGPAAQASPNPDSILLY
jgi:hypothetical protein